MRCGSPPGAPRARRDGLGPLVALGLALAVSLPAPAEPASRRLNGFVLEPRSVRIRDIERGGPPRDGIPALDHPKSVTAATAPYADDERVVGVSVGADSRAYPLSVLVWHELVNDEIGGVPLLVSYCPLCGTALVFDRRVDGGAAPGGSGGAARRFGVSGLLYRSDLLMYDRETESLWSQIGAEAVAGPSLGQRLALRRSKLETWGRWRRAHPETTVLSTRTGHRRAYGTRPYGDYETSRKLLFSVRRDRRYHPKEPTLGVRTRGGAARAYPASEVDRNGGRVAERFEGHAVAVALDPEARTFSVSAPDEVEVIEGFWFAWMAFHPDSSVFAAPRDR